MSLLAVDIGNTSVSVCRLRGTRPVQVKRIPRQRAFKVSEIEAILCDYADSGAIQGVIGASVVPAINSRWSRAAKRIFQVEICWIDHTLPLGFAIDYPEPATIGADRLANAAGAIQRYGCPVVVADLGTALTFDVVSGQGAYIGGVIAPGLAMMYSYLSEKTAKLPLLKPRTVNAGVGRSTEEAMQIGGRSGYRGMMDGIFERIEQDLPTAPVRVATGGYARWICRGWSRSVVVDSNLTLYGLACIAKENKFGS